MTDTPRTDAVITYARTLERELAETKRLLVEARDTLSHGMVFFLAREKMHETGIALAQDLLTRIDAAIKEQK
jgi:hypothetical protein